MSIITDPLSIVAESAGCHALAHPVELISVHRAARAVMKCSGDSAD